MADICCYGVRYG